MKKISYCIFFLCAVTATEAAYSSGELSQQERRKVEESIMKGQGMADNFHVSSSEPQKEEFNDLNELEDQRRKLLLKQKEIMGMLRDSLNLRKDQNDIHSSQVGERLSHIKALQEHGKSIKNDLYQQRHGLSSRGNMFSEDQKRLDMMNLKKINKIKSSLKHLDRGQKETIKEQNKKNRQWEEKIQSMESDIRSVQAEIKEIEEKILLKGRDLMARDYGMMNQKQAMIQNDEMMNNSMMNRGVKRQNPFVIDKTCGFMSRKRVAIQNDDMTHNPIMIIPNNLMMDGNMMGKSGSDVDPRQDIRGHGYGMTNQGINNTVPQNKFIFSNQCPAMTNRDVNDIVVSKKFTPMCGNSSYEEKRNS